MIKSLLRQRRQVQSTEDYRDLNYIDGGQGPRELLGNVHDISYAESVSNLEQDLNNLRSQLRDIIGRGTWYAEAPLSLQELENIITTKENELLKLQKHENLFHSSRPSDTLFSFDANDNLEKITLVKPGTQDIIQESIFVFDAQDNILFITKTIWDNDLIEYLKLKKDFYYNSNGNILSISNSIL